MSFGIKVNGGTGAGVKRHRAQVTLTPWTCPGCSYGNPRWAANCLNCNQARA